jgi:hypothetical protein
MLYLDENRQAELNANLVRDRPEIKRIVRAVCKLLNTLSQDGAMYAHAWVGPELINSLTDDKEQAIELSRIIQRQIEREMQMVHAPESPTVN